MKKIINTIKTLAITLFLINPIYMHGCMRAINRMIKLQNGDNITYYHKKALTSAEYNKTNKLLTLPHNVLTTILSHLDNSKSLQNIMPSVLSLSATCKQFDEKLPTIINKCYYNEEKNDAMKQLLSKITYSTYYKKRHAISLLICSGANHMVCSDDDFLLKKVIIYDDREMVNTLLINGANPYFMPCTWDVPACYYTHTVEMAQTLKDHHVDLNMPFSGDYPNILYSITMRNPSSALMQFYLDNKVDTNIMHKNGNCIMHHLIGCVYKANNGIEDYVQMCELLLKANSKLINVINNEGQTPLALAHIKADQYYKDCQDLKILKKLITLFEQYSSKIL